MTMQQSKIIAGGHEERGGVGDKQCLTFVSFIPLQVHTFKRLIIITTYINKQ